MTRVAHQHPDPCRLKQQEKRLPGVGAKQIAHQRPASQEVSGCEPRNPQTAWVMPVSGDDDAVQVSRPEMIVTGVRTGSEWGKLLSHCLTCVVDVTSPRGIDDDVVIATTTTDRHSSPGRCDTGFLYL